MRIFNKFVESKKEPQNKNDIWFDGEVCNIYKEGKWQAFTLELDAANKVKQIIDNAFNAITFKSVPANMTISKKTLTSMLGISMTMFEDIFINNDKYPTIKYLSRTYKSLGVSNGTVYYINGIDVLSFSMDLEITSSPYQDVIVKWRKLNLV